MTSRLRHVCEKNGISLLYLFGSQARSALDYLQNNGATGDVGDPLADLDIGVVTSSPLPPAGERHELYASLTNDLQECFPGFPVEVVLLEEHHSVFQYEALKGFCIYCSSVEAKDRYEISVLRRAADFAPFLDQFLTEALEEVAR